MPSARSASPRTSAKQEKREKRPAFSPGGWATLVGVSLILGGIAATLAWQWPTITELYELLNHNAETPQSRGAGHPELSPQVGIGEPSSQSPGASSLSSRAALPAASLIEANANDPQGKRYIGTVTWRTETVSGATGAAPELVLRGDIEIPERRMTVNWSMGRNTDKGLPASHMIEITFNLPPDFAGGGIAK